MCISLKKKFYENEWIKIKRTLKKCFNPCTLNLIQCMSLSKIEYSVTLW